MSDTTSILDLPTDPTGGGHISNNINICCSVSISVPITTSVFTTN